MRNVNDYLLIRHTPGGRQYPRLDCWGLIVDYYRENLGITLGEHTDLSHETMAAGMQRERGHFREVKTPENGDIVAFFLSGRLYHVGIWIDGRILHTSERRNARYEKMGGALTDRRYYRYDAAN